MSQKRRFLERQMAPGSTDVGITPNSRQSFPTIVSGFPIATIARRNFAVVILKGAPPFRPLARAAAIPALVRSTISSRSNSAKAAKIPNTNFPVGVVVSMVAP